MHRPTDPLYNTEGDSRSVLSLTNRYFQTFPTPDYVISKILFRWKRYRKTLLLNVGFSLPIRSLLLMVRLILSHYLF